MADNVVITLEICPVKIKINDIDMAPYTTGYNIYHQEKYIEFDLVGVDTPVNKIIDYALEEKTCTMVVEDNEYPARLRLSKIDGSVPLLQKSTILIYY